MASCWPSSDGHSIENSPFKVEERHFKLGIGLLLVSMAMLALFGGVFPLREIAYTSPAFLLGYRGVAAPIAVFGYMLTDTGHDGLFKPPEVQNRSTEPIQKAICSHFLSPCSVSSWWCFF